MARKRSALGGRISHGADMQVGNIAHVNGTEIELWNAGHGAIHQALHQQNRGRIIRPKNRPEHADRIDDRKLEAAALLGDEIPGRALGYRFRFHVSGQVVAMKVRPVRLVERRILLFVAVSYCRERRRQHHALDAGVARGAQHAQRAVTRRHDQIVFMPGNARGKWRGNVQHIIATGDRFGPARIVFEIGRDKGQPTARFGAALLEQGAHIGLAPQAAYSGADLMICGQKLKDRMAADEPGPAGNQNYAHCGLFLLAFGVKAKHPSSYLFRVRAGAARVEPTARLLHSVAVLDAVDGDGIGHSFPAFLCDTSTRQRRAARRKATF